MGWFILWVGLSILAGVVASNKGRSGFGFFLLALLLSPLIGLTAALVVAANRREMEYRQIVDGDMKKCPFCAELVRTEARICKHCGKDLVETEPEQPKGPIEKVDDASLMNQYGVTFDGEKYRFGEYRYDKLQDALNYARLQGTKTA